MAQEIKGVSFPGWDVIRKIGEGSFGGVYEISRTLPNGKVECAALKKLTVPRDVEEIRILHAQSFTADQITAYFKNQMEELVREYTFMQDLSNSPNIVSCQDIRCIQHERGIGWDIYIRMELLKPLRKTISAQYSEPEILRLGMDICRALMACESRNIIHRDIKPENILVSENGRYKLADFGIAKVSEKTETGTMAGTNGYMAPEVANHQKYGKEVDIYSLGMVLYWLMNQNTLPFLPLPPTIPTAEQKQEAISRRFDGEAIPAPHNGSEILKRIVLRACSFDPADRFQSAREFGAALQYAYRNYKATDTDGILQEIGISKNLLHEDSSEEKEATADAKPQNQKHKKRNIMLGLAAAVLLCAVGGVGISRLSDKHQAHPPTEDTTPTALVDVDEAEVAAPEIQTIPIPTYPFDYEVIDDGVQITAWKDRQASEAVLPETLDGQPVIEIADGVFSGLTQLKQLQLPDSILSIGKSCFAQCSKLERVRLPNELTAIPDEMFSGCSALTDIILPDSLEQIGKNAFYQCRSLAIMDIPENVLQIGDGAFFDSGVISVSLHYRWEKEYTRFLPKNCEPVFYGYERPVLSGEIGDTITFGHYEQDNNLSNGPEPIEWQILDKDGSKLYVISKYGLDSQKYHDKGGIVTWETSMLRVWLNQTFFAAAFNPAEQGMVVLSDVHSISPNDANLNRTVQDKVFLLDYNGSYQYFKGEKARTCIATPYAQAQGSQNQFGGQCWWWLSEGYIVDLASIPVLRRDYVRNAGGTVRPVMWIETSE